VVVGKMCTSVLTLYRLNFEIQFNPALAIASAVMGKFKKPHNIERHEKHRRDILTVPNTIEIKD